MTFFYDLNKRLADLAKKQNLNESKVAESEKWIQNAVNPANKGGLHKALHVAQDKTIPKAKIEKATHSKNPKLRHMAQFAKNVANEEMADEGNAFTGKLASTPKGGSFKLGDKEFKDTSSIEEGTCPACNCAPCKCDSMDESAFQAAIGKKKYGDQGMKALQKAGREHASAKTMSNIRNKYDKYNESQGMADEGNAFTAKLKATPKGGSFKLGDKEFKDTSDIEEGFKEMDAWLASREKEKGTGKFDKKERSMPDGIKATTYTRKHEDDDEEDDRDDSKSKQADKYASPKKKGRPKSAASKDSERVTKRSHKYKTVDGKRVKKEKADEGLDSDGVMMTRPTNCSMEDVEHKSNPKVEAWNSLMDLCERGKGMEPAVLKRLKQLVRKLKPEELELDEEKVEAGKREFFDRIAPAAKKAAKVIGAIAKHRTPVEEESTDKEDTKAEKAGKKVAKDIEYDESHKGKDDNKAEKAGKKVTKDIEYDDKKDRKEKKADKEEKVEETTVAGSVAPAQNAAPKASKGMQFGKGVYESFNSSVEKMITEGINVTVNVAQDEAGQPQKSITVDANGEDADKLAQLLSLAGMHRPESNCSTCGNSPCGCAEVVDENSPDWPTNTETLAAQPELRTYSGGLNGPKSTGQSTTPVLASQLRRQASMEESVELERSLFKTWKNYKG